MTDPRPTPEKILLAVEFELMMLADQWNQKFQSPFGFLVFDLGSENARAVGQIQSPEMVQTALASGRKFLYAIGPAEGIEGFFLQHGGTKAQWDEADATAKKLDETLAIVVSDDVHLVGATIVKYVFSKGGSALGPSGRASRARNADARATPAHLFTARQVADHAVIEVSLARHRRVRSVVRREREHLRTTLSARAVLRFAASADQTLPCVKNAKRFLAMRS